MNSPLPAPVKQHEPTIAYFSMEIGLSPKIPTYSGGLGMLAGDTLRSAADLGIPMAGVTLAYRKGYFTQKLDASGWQHEEAAYWPLEEFLKPCDARASLQIEGRTVQLRAWRYDVKGQSGFTVPVYLLDSDVEGNAAQDRELTHTLYGGDQRYRLCQEAILGIGGVRILRALGLREIERFHMNEGHASLLVLELLQEVEPGGSTAGIDAEDIEAVRQRCVFTTHTPVPAGHDEFPLELVTQVLGEQELFQKYPEIFTPNKRMNMTTLALNLSHYINGVAKRHGEVSRSMFPQFPIDSITNGVHCGTWASDSFQALFDLHIPGWREDNFNLRHALKISAQEVLKAHQMAKRSLLDYVAQKTGVVMDPEALTIGFARRAATYKRAELLFFDVERLKQIVQDFGPLQFVYAGKAHPRDQEGKLVIQRVVQAGRSLGDKLRFVYLENYEMMLGKLISSGVDVWLNNPQPPLEASGTSGMKAALNGVPSLSVLDGWWIEGHIEGVTGWAIGDHPLHREKANPQAADARDLYEKLKKVMQLYYRHTDKFVDVMRCAIALNGSFFNTQRMVQQYVIRAYFR